MIQNEADIKLFKKKKKVGGCGDAGGLSVEGLSRHVVGAMEVGA